MSETETARGPATVRFGAFELDAVARQLSRGGQPIRLAPRIYSLLCYLVERPGQAVTRDELMDELWPGVSVSDQSLTEAVWRLRRALDDDPKSPQFIETIPGYGFRFIAPVQEVDRHSAAPMEPPRVPLWKLALPGTALSALMLAVAVGAVFLWAGPGPGERPRLSDIVLPDGAPVRDFRAELSPGDARLAYVRSDPPRLEVLDLGRDEVTILGALARVWNSRQLRWSPDGSLLALSDRPAPGGEGVIELFEVASGARRVVFREPGGSLALLGWSPEGGKLLVHEVAGDGSGDGSSDGNLLLLGLDGAVLARWPVGGLTSGRVSPDGRWLAAWVIPDGPSLLDGEIVIMPLDGVWSDQARPGPDTFRGWPGSARIGEPSAHDEAYWSKDSSRLIYFSNRGGGRALWLVELEEGRPTRQPRLLEVPGDPYMVQGWLADGRILFCSFDTGWDVYVAGFDPDTKSLTSEPALVSLWEGRARLTLWGQEPERLMYASFHEDPVAGDMYVASLTDDPVQPLSGEPVRVEIDGRFLWPDWDSVRGRLYFMRRLEDRSSGLFALDLESGAEQRLLGDHVLAGDLAPHLDAAGRLLVFHTTTPRADGMPEPTLAPGIYVYDLETGVHHRVVDGEMDHARLSPDGGWIAATDESALEVQLFSVESGERRVLATVPPGGWRLRAPFWFSPDGTSLGFVVTRDLPESLCGESDIWIVDRGGGVPRRLEGVAALDPQGANWSPDGHRLAFSSWKCNSTVRLFDPS